MYSHNLDYRIIGDDIQLVEIELDSMETVIAEAGSMMYMDSGVAFETKMGKSVSLWMRYPCAVSSPGWT